MANQEIQFEVVGRNKTEKLTKKGSLEVIYKVTLKGANMPNGEYRLTIADTSPALLQKYPMDSNVMVKIGASDQLTLSDAQIEKEVEKAAEASAEDQAEKGR